MPAALTRRRFTADEYQQMGRAGILREADRVELIDGEIVAMSPIGPRHSACVGSATRALVRAAGDDAIVLPQGSVRLGLHHEPQSDLVLLRPRADFYASRHAGPDDILLVIEIADSSLEYDQDVKARVYAASRVPEYWLADLRAGVVWRHSLPEQAGYQRIEPRRRGESMSPLLLPSCAIDVDALLIA
jgi:Uma2 family endonuclease